MRVSPFGAGLDRGGPGGLCLRPPSRPFRAHQQIRTTLQIWHERLVMHNWD